MSRGADDLFDRMLFQAKLDLYGLLHRKRAETMTEDEVEILFRLSRDPGVQARLDEAKQREAR
jgi:hypothetical protein